MRGLFQSMSKPAQTLCNARESKPVCYNASDTSIASQPKARTRHQWRLISLHRERKAILAERPVAFNISHSESRGLIALSTHGAVGIDLEAIHPLPELQALAKRYFSATEQTTLDEVSGAQETERFYQIWTRKEGGAGKRLRSQFRRGLQ